MNDKLENVSPDALNAEPTGTIPAGIPDDDLYIFEDTASAGTPMGFSERLISLFAAPGLFAENLKHFPKFGAAIICIVVLGVICSILTLMIAPILANAQSVAIAERYGVDFVNMTQAMEVLAEMPAAMTLFFASLSMFISIVVGALLGAVAIKLISLVMKGCATFKQYLSLMIHTSVITLVGSVVIYLLMYFTENPTVPTSLAAMLMPNGNFFNPMFNLLQSIELFGIWAAVIVAIGVKKFNPGFSNGKVAVAAGIYYALSVIVTAAITSLPIISFDALYQSLYMM
jgi:hypothetical protein